MSDSQSRQWAAAFGIREVQLCRCRATAAAAAPQQLLQRGDPSVLRMAGRGRGQQ